MFNPLKVVVVHVWQRLDIWKCPPKRETAHTVGGVAIYGVFGELYKFYIRTLFCIAGLFIVLKWVPTSYSMHVTLTLHTGPSSDSDFQCLSELNLEDGSSPSEGEFL